MGAELARVRRLSEVISDQSGCVTTGDDGDATAATASETVATAPPKHKDQMPTEGIENKPQSPGERTSAVCRPGGGVSAAETKIRNARSR